MKIDPYCTLKQPLRTYAAIMIQDQQGRFYAMKRRADGYWCFPGGKIESGELPLVAAARELKEETGISASGLKFLGEYIGIAPDGTPWLGYYFVLLSGNTVPGIEEPEKFSSHNFFTLDEMEEEGMHPEYQATIDFLHRWQAA